MSHSFGEYFFCFLEHSALSDKQSVFLYTISDRQKVLIAEIHAKGITTYALGHFLVCQLILN